MKTEALVKLYLQGKDPVLREKIIEDLDQVLDNLICSGGTERFLKEDLKVERDELQLYSIELEGDNEALRQYREQQGVYA